jgi:hypothetical protein
MGKSKAKLITASEKVVGLVRRGYELDVEIKNLGFEDKGIKKMLSEELEEEFGEDTSVRVEANECAAVVTQSEKFVVKGDAESISAVRDAVENGLLGDAVKTERVLNVPVADREKAAEILKAAGIGATTTVNLTVDPAEYRTLKDSESSSAEAAEAKKTLEGITERKVSYRVKYEKV